MHFKQAKAFSPASWQHLTDLLDNQTTSTARRRRRRTYPEGKDPRKRPHEDLRWLRFKHFEFKEMFEVMAEHVFPFLWTLGGDDSTYAHHMKDARFTIPTQASFAMMLLPEHEPERKKMRQPVRYLVFGDQPSRYNEFYCDTFIKARTQLGSSHAAHDTV